MSTSDSSMDEMLAELKKSKLAKITPPEQVVVTAYFPGENGETAEAGSFSKSTSIGDIMVWAQTVNEDPFGRSKKPTRVTLSVDLGLGWSRPQE